MTTGSDNTANGRRALHSNTTGIRNTASGSYALDGNTSGAGNTASGWFALRLNTTGGENTASGALALDANTTGSWNTASGFQALTLNTTGISNTASGYQALLYNVTGGLNTACGSFALRENTTGNDNTACGWKALYGNTTGAGNIGVGILAGFNLTTGNDNIAIGNSGVAGEGATVRLGTAGTHTRTLIAGIRGVTTGVADAIPVVVDSAGQLGTVSSSRRFKKDIADMGDLSGRLLELRPVVFHYKQEQTLPNGAEVPLEYGLIAEEVAEIFPDLVVYDDEGKPFTVKYHLLSAMLLNEMKKQHEQIEAQSSEHERELRELEELRARLNALEAKASPAVIPAETK